MNRNRFITSASVKLSLQQRTVLLSLLALQHARPGAPDDAIPWRGTRDAGGVRRASVSRALRALEQRGLVERERPLGRTLRLRMTETGLAEASRQLRLLTVFEEKAALME